ncbi:putative 1-acylglycerol-3-phosphate O-acyltransferase [Chlorella vulgaris]
MTVANTSASQATRAAAPNAAPTLNWWQRLRWRPTSHTEGVFKERQLLDLLQRNYEQSDVKVGPGKQDFMHMVTATADVPGAPAFVAIPGYGSGSAFLWKLFDGLSSACNLYAIDLLGTGLSGRPPFKARNTAEAEEFFVTSLDAWRREQGLEKMVLMGHSMGGYLSACYALKHPDRVQHLILMCPAGVGKQPEDWQPPASLQNPWTVRGQLFRFATRAWDWGVTPGSLIRGLGPWGPRMAAGYCRSRFTKQQQMTDEEVAIFGAYHYHTVAAPGSGEHALRHILAPFAWPRSPLEDRMRQLQVPTTFIYGEHDWMDVKAARRLTAAMAEQRAPKFASDLKVLVTQDAGHYPAIDQPGSVLRQLAQTCESYLPPAAKQAMLVAAQRQPFHGVVRTDSASAMAAELAYSPMQAAAREASEL